MILRSFNNIELIDYLIIFILIEVIFIFFYLGFLFLKKAKDKQERIKIYLLCIAFFLILYGIDRIIFFLHEFLFENFVWSISPMDFSETLKNDSEKAFIYDIVWRIGTSIGSAGLLIFLLGFESKILEKKTKFIFSIIQCTTLVLSLIFGTTADEITIGRLILYFGLLPALAIPICYFYLGGKAKGIARKRAIGAGLGFLIFYLGVAVNSTAGKTIFYFILGGMTGVYLSYIIYCVFVNLGLIIYMKSIQY